jgi:sporulation protein YlmC with PRC-barrel domain
MILSDLLGNPVHDASGRRVGRVVDARFRLAGRSTPAKAHLVGLVVSPRSASSYLGYERTATSRPVVIDRFLRWRHRGSFLVAWEDVQRVSDTTVRLRKGYQRLDAALPDGDG